MFYDLNEIKAVPCRDIAERYGIQLKKVGNRLWGKLRQDERTASFAIKISTNRWDDFGLGESGSNIDLVMKLEGVDKTEAINHIAEDFGIDPEKIERNKWRTLSDKQYGELGIAYPQRATLNFGYDLTKHTEEQLKRWNDKYAVPLKILAKKYPDVYNKLVEKFALEQIKEVKDKYFETLRHYFNPTYNEIDLKITKDALQELEKSINSKIDLLQKAVTTIKKNYDYLKVNLDADLHNYTNKKLINIEDHTQKNIEIGELIVDNSGVYRIITDVMEEKYESFEIVLKEARKASITDIPVKLDGKQHDYECAFVCAGTVNYITKADIHRKLGKLEKDILDSVLEKVNLFKSKNLVQQKSNIKENNLNLGNSIELSQKLNIS